MTFECGILVKKKDLSRVEDVSCPGASSLQSVDDWSLLPRLP